MCTTQFHFITYNTHLFFKDLVQSHETCFDSRPM